MFMMDCYTMGGTLLCGPSQPGEIFSGSIIPWDDCRTNLAETRNIAAQEMAGRALGFLRDQVLSLDSNATGVWTSAGSTANEHAMYLAREKTNRNIVIGTNLTHISIIHACKKLGMRFEAVPTNPDNRFRVPAQELRNILASRADEVAGVVVTCGTTHLGTSDDFDYTAELDQTIIDNGICLHLDEACGAPYLNFGANACRRTATAWQKAKALTTLTADLHKFFIPTSSACLFTAGLMIMTDPEDLKFIQPEVAYFSYSPYVASGTTISVTPLAFFVNDMESAARVMRDLGADEFQINSGIKELYQRSAKECHKWAVAMGEKIRKRGLQLLNPIETNMIPIGFNSREERDDFLAGAKTAGFDLSPIQIECSSRTYYGARIAVSPRILLEKGNFKPFLKFCADFHAHKESTREPAVPQLI